MILLFSIILVLGILYWLFMSSYSQIFGSFPYRIETDAKVIALTFDDGPNEPFTSDLLDYLKEQRVTATFFEVGKCVEKYPEVTKRLYRDGHTIGNHSYSHAFHKYFINPSFKKEIEKTQQIIFDTIGKKPTLFRPPWLLRQPFILRSAKKSGLKTISGEFGHALEVFQPSSAKMAKHVIKMAKPGSIIIFHDGFDSKGGNRAMTVEAVKIFVPELLSEGYKFVTIDQLLGMPAYQS